MGTMWTCDSCADVCASRVNRVRMAGSYASSGGSTLIATDRFRRMSRARYTTDIPPRPISLSTSYWCPSAATTRSVSESLITARFECPSTYRAAISPRSGAKPSNRGLSNARFSRPLVHVVPGSSESGRAVPATRTSPTMTEAIHGAKQDGRRAAKADGTAVWVEAPRSEDRRGGEGSEKGNRRGKGHAAHRRREEEPSREDRRVPACEGEKALGVRGLGGLWAGQPDRHTSRGPDDGDGDALHYP